MADARSPEAQGPRTCAWCAAKVTPDLLMCPNCGTELSGLVEVRPGRRGPRARARPSFDGRALPDLGARWWGRVVDSLIVGLPAGLLVRVVVHGRARVAAGAILVFLYEALCYAMWGRTLGKVVAGTRLVGRESRDRPTVEQALLRALVTSVPTLVLVPKPLVGILLADLAAIIIYLPVVRGRERRGLHDLLAGTIVISARS